MLNHTNITLFTDRAFDNLLDSVKELTNCYNINPHFTEAVIRYYGVALHIRLESNDPNNIFNWVELTPMPNGQKGEWMLSFVLNPNVKLIDNDKYSLRYIKIGYNERRYAHDFTELYDLLANVQ